MDRNHSHYSNQPRNQFSSPSDPKIGRSIRKSFYRLIHHTPEWPNISQAFEPIASGQAKLHEVYATIEDCMNRYSSGANFPTNTLLLEQFIGFLPAKQQNEWEKEIFPGLAKIILKTPELFPDDISVPLLLQRSQETVRLTKEQCFCLLAHMFMCTTLDNQEKYLPKPYNFCRLLTLEDPKHSPLRAQKLHCLYNYFRQALKNKEETFVIFRRLVHEEDRLGKCDLEDWTTCRTVLLPVEIKPKGGIEEAKGCLEIDFANKYLGGGVLGNGATQEEIMMITSPESLVGLLFCESMRPEEAILIQGAGMMCNYQGFSRSFKFDGNREENYKVNELNAIDRDIIAIDALDLRDEKLPGQFTEGLILRELNKAYIGFYGVHKGEEETKKKPIATGKWGCGVFAGNLHLKFILQWIAASRAGRAMEFYSFGDQGLKNVENIIQYYEGKDVCEILKDVLECTKTVGKKHDDKFDLLNALKGLRFSG